MVRRVRLVFVAPLVLLAALPATGHAAVAFTIDDTTGLRLGNPPFTLGYSFTVAGPISVNSLGVFDDSQDGLAESHAVGLWNSAGTLLSSVTVGAGTAGTLVNQFRYASVSPLVLTAGDYRIGALFGTGADNVAGFNGVNNLGAAPGLTFGTRSFASGATLTNPVFDFGPSTGYFGPNFQFGAVGAVPEPATWAMMLGGFGMIGVSLRRRRKVTVSYA